MVQEAWIEHKTCDIITSSITNYSSAHYLHECLELNNQQTNWDISNNMSLYSRLDLHKSQNLEFISTRMINMRKDLLDFYYMIDRFLTIRQVSMWYRTNLKNRLHYLSETNSVRDITEAPV